MILNAIPENIKNFLFEIEKLGFNLCLIGGAVRNYLAHNELGNDLDFEVRSKIEILDSDWELYFFKIRDCALKNQFKIDSLPYLILRVYVDQFTLEFSSPRVEKFHIDNFQHHNFDAFLSSNFSFKDSFRRRDFTINAIGALLDIQNQSFQLIDPYNGQNDLKLKKLEKISDEFFNDSVRFIRLIRFQVNLDFEISPAIFEKMYLFNLLQLSEYHFKQELKKADIGKFLNHFISTVKENKLQLSSKLAFLSSISFQFPEKKINNVDQLIYFSLFQNENSCKGFLELYQQPKNLFTKLLKLKKSIVFLKNLNIEFFTSELQQPVLVFKNSPVYMEIKIILDNLDIYSNLMSYISIADFLKYEKIKLVKEFKLADEVRNKEIPELRSVYEIQEGLKNVFQ